MAKRIALQAHLAVVQHDNAGQLEVANVSLKLRCTLTAGLKRGQWSAFWQWTHLLAARDAPCGKNPIPVCEPELTLCLVPSDPRATQRLRVNFGRRHALRKRCTRESGYESDWEKTDKG